MQHPIRHAALHDLAELDRIEQESFNTPWSRELIRGAIYNMRYDVRVIRPRGGPLMGFYIAHGVHGRSNLDNLAVDGSQRRHGHGRCLLADWMQRATNAGLASLTLQVNTANRVAQFLYQEHGFQIRRLLKGYYTNGEDAYEMERLLEQEAPAFAGERFSFPQFRLSGGWLRGTS